MVKCINRIYLYDEIALINDTTWMNFKNIMLSEKNQSQRTTCYMVLLYGMPRIGKSIGVEDKWFSRGWDWGGGRRNWALLIEHCLMGVGFLLG